ncbi:hypothetical protein CDL12_04287 [Handroanthus impetiginosus]|uniref:Uncharacterized protein n=1 Tax=Handroanthus impetiginosus TaxID=429701 RepID=A0A2G9HZP1_9LAMI|nr:hypothetical protein CDL12_04287 [Handroanthus impetiginosus]
MYSEVEASGSDQTPEPVPSAVELGDLSSTSTLTNSKRWRYIFKKNGKKTSDSASDDHICTKKKDTSVKEKVKRDKKNGGAVGGAASSNVVSAAELNINIWPFSRSRSAGTGGTRPRSTSSTRKVSSAPCSRSNSTGESKYKKWPNSPSRAGVHLGRSSPVWQVRRGGGGGGRSLEAFVKNAERGAKKDENEGRRKIPAAASGGGGTKGRALSLNVPMCIGYRHNLSCKSEESTPLTVADSTSAGGGGGEGEIVGCISGEGVRRSNLFNIKSLFTKKVH